nr:MAG TPA: hypothetical protein [Caudoviricetes sp.]
MWLLRYISYCNGKQLSNAGCSKKGPRRGLIATCC